MSASTAFFAAQKNRNPARDSGLLDFLFAVLFFSRPQQVILVLPIIIGIMIMIDSMFKLQMAFDLKRMGLRRWWSMLLL